MKPTHPSPLPYKGAPLDIRDLILREVNYEEKFLLKTETVELPKHEKPIKIKWTPTNVVAFAAHISKRSLSLMTP